MGKKLYVGNLSYSTTEDDIRDAFAKIGEVASAKLIIDQTNGRSKGFGFVEMASDDDAAKAITAMNGTMFQDRTITVNEARPMAERGRSGGGGYGGGGGRDSRGGGGGYGGGGGRGGKGGGGGGGWR
jgi:cold-inducible RNA-binding protein